jgi:hypothetical protein
LGKGIPERSLAHVADWNLLDRSPPIGLVATAKKRLFISVAVPTFNIPARFATSLKAFHQLDYPVNFLVVIVAAHGSKALQKRTASVTVMMFLPVSQMADTLEFAWVWVKGQND